MASEESPSTVDIPAENGNNNEKVEVEQATEAEDVNEIRAVFLTAFGGLQRMKVQKISEPTPLEGEVVVRVKACGLSFVDLMLRQGALENPPKTPLVMGFECAGVVEATGTGATKFQHGDRVIVFKRYGTWAEIVTAAERFCFRMPASMSFEEAASLPMSYLTAYMMLFDIASIKSGKSVLVHSAGGGVGTAVSQLCKTVENVQLYGTASAHKHDGLQGQFTHLVDRNTHDYHHEIKSLSPDGIDVVLDCLCGDDTNKGYTLLAPMGKYVLYGSSNIVTGETRSFLSYAKSWWQVDKINPIKLYEENKSIAGFNLLNLVFEQGRHDLLSHVMAELIQMYNQNKIKPIIDSTWAFEEITDAMQRMHDHKNIGKIILNPNQERRRQSCHNDIRRDSYSQSSDISPPTSSEK
ncbi:synaptic vesicle membrane protein VAT-1 homolog-like [Antedon mediterranea]|uniref:synaptic vesicle membrane protein VAT-1 homolog-like n=1 Tax=Antedon mediterranea TaxID=105859 RepID=UPI003AF8FF44